MSKKKKYLKFEDRKKTLREILFVLKKIAQKSMAH